MLHVIWEIKKNVLPCFCLPFRGISLKEGMTQVVTRLRPSFFQTTIKKMCLFDESHEQQVWMCHTYKCLPQYPCGAYKLVERNLCSLGGLLTGVNHHVYGHLNESAYYEPTVVVTKILLFVGTGGWTFEVVPGSHCSKLRWKVPWDLWVFWNSNFGVLEKCVPCKGEPVPPNF